MAPREKGVEYKAALNRLYDTIPEREQSVSDYSTIPESSQIEPVCWEGRAPGTAASIMSITRAPIRDPAS